MRQKHTKHKSIYTEKFIKTVMYLSNTKVYICRKMLEKTKTLVDLEYQKLINEEVLILKRFNNTFKKYNEYKLAIGLEPNELWVRTSLDILIKDYTELTKNKSIHESSLLSVERTYKELVSNSIKGIDGSLKHLKLSITHNEKRIYQDINKKKYFLQIEISKLQKHLSKISAINF